MTRVSVKEARGNFSKLLHRVQAGEEVAVTHRGKEIVRMSPAVLAAPGTFPSHKALRDSIRPKGKSTSRHVSEMRDEEQW